MTKLIGFVFLIFCQISLIACVEVRDQKKEEVSPEAPVTQATAAEAKNELPDLVINQDYFVYQGRIMTRREIDDESFHKTRGLAKSLLPEASQNLSFRFRTLTFTSQGTLFLQGNNVKIVATKIESSGGKIISFQEDDQKATGSKPGLSGGFVQLKADEGDGVLEIYLRGQDGADGIHGKNGEQAEFCDPEKRFKGVYNPTAGTSGTKGGDSGSFQSDIVADNLEIRLRELRAGKGGVKGLAGTVTNCKIIAAGDHPIVMATDGEDGADGIVNQFIKK